VNIFAENFNLKEHSLNRISKSALDLIGNTSLLEINKIGNIGACIYAKTEFQNPSGSIKDRMVKYAIIAAEQRGDLSPGDIIVEASSGNTGVSVSMVAALKGYTAVIIVPDITSNVKVNMMKKYGAEVLKVNADHGIQAVVDKAKEVKDQRGAFLLDQFNNPDNKKAHQITGNEILRQVKKVDAFVAGVGTGGTLVGVAEVLKKENPLTRIIAMEPQTAPAFYNLFHGTSLPIGSGIPHKIEGIGETFVPQLLERNMSLVDDVVLVSDSDALQTMNELARKEGVSAGISSGANIYATTKVSETMRKETNLVTVLPDSGQRYLLM
jgi:cysteine synthase A